MLSTFHKVALLGAAAALVSCSSTQNPVSGRNELTSVSTAQELKIGAEQHPKILKEFGGVYNERGVGDYVADLGNRLLANSQVPNQKFTFTVLDDPTVNAFAVPGGYVYITRGIMALASDEAEIAGVIGHEIGHIAGRHSAQRRTRQQVAGLGQLAAVLGAAAAGLDANSARQLTQASSVAARGSVSQFSQKQELEADRLGVEYLAETGYNPFALSDVLSKMQAQQALSAQLKGKDYDPNKVGFFSTHPATASRFQQALDTARASGVPLDNTAPRNPESYMRALDGMIYGDAPSEGYVRNNSFWHPDLGFAFDAPRGWEIKNTDKAVGVMPSGTKNTLAILTSAKPQGSLEQVAARTTQKARIVERPRNSTINGFPALTLVTAGKKDGVALNNRIVLIDAGDRLYRWQMIAPERQFKQLDHQFEQLAISFRRIDPNGAPPPLRIRTRQVAAGETVQSLAAQTGFDNNKEARFRVLNGFGRGQQPRPGQWVKLVQ